MPMSFILCQNNPESIFFGLNKDIFRLSFFNCCDWTTLTSEGFSVPSDWYIVSIGICVFPLNALPIVTDTLSGTASQGVFKSRNCYNVSWQPTKKLACVLCSCQKLPRP